jgi:hypothetical protein
MIRDLFRAALAAIVLWPAAPSRPAAPPVPAPAPVMLPVAAPWPAQPPPPGPVARIIGAADRVAARWLPPL